VTLYAGASIIRVELYAESGKKMYGYGRQDGTGVLNEPTGNGVKNIDP
jgi:hypothetical protein